VGVGMSGVVVVGVSWEVLSDASFKEEFEVLVLCIMVVKELL
jgi:hypothetical protein